MSWNFDKGICNGLVGYEIIVFVLLKCKNFIYLLIKLLVYMYINFMELIKFVVLLFKKIFCFIFCIKYR